MNYAHQHRLLSFALRGVQCAFPFVDASAVFRHWHGYRDARKGWSFFEDAELVCLVRSIERQRDNSREWRRLLQAVTREASLRSLLPSTADEFRVAWDRCAASGAIQPGDEAWAITRGVA